LLCWFAQAFVTVNRDNPPVAIKRAPSGGYVRFLSGIPLERHKAASVADVTASDMVLDRRAKHQAKI